MRDKAWRRKQRNRKIVKRSKYRTAECIKEEYLGYLDKNHYGCGCSMCKPWKHKAYGEPRFKHSEMVQLEEKIDWGEMEYYFLRGRY